LKELTEKPLTDLEKSEDKYQTIFEWSRDAIILTDSEGKTMDINRSGIDILGYETREEVLSLRSLIDVFESRKDVYRLRDKVLQKGSITEYETKLVGKGDRVFDALATCSVIVDDKGGTIGYVIIIRDISKRKRAQEQIELQNAGLTILNAVSMTVSSSLNLNNVLERTIDKILEILEPDNIRIYLYDDERECLDLVTHKGLSAKFVTKSFIKCRRVGDGLLGQAILTGQARVVDNFLRSEDPYVDAIIEEGLQSTVYIPLVSKEKPVGVMCVSSHSGFRFSTDYVEFLTAIGNQIGMAIDNANLYENVKWAYQELTKAQELIERQNTRLTTLNTVAMAVSSSLDLNDVLDRTIDRMVDILEPESVRIYMFDSGRGRLDLVAHKGLSDKFVNKNFIRRRKEGDGLLGKTILTGQTRVVDNFLRSEDPYVNAIIEEGLQSTAYIPLVSKKKPVGVMCVSSHSEFRFSQDYVEFLTAIGNQIGVAIDNANLYENIKRAYQELTEAQEQVIQTEKLASLGKLAATIAHEINNPLAAVLTYVRLMRKLMSLNRFGPERLEDISRYLTTMESETARCGDIVKNLLAFSRQSKITIEDHSIEEIIDRTLTIIAHDLEMKEIRLYKEINPNLPKVRCDFRQIQQSLLNIMINASEAMKKGGALTVKAQYSEDDTFLEVSIADTGCGIREEDMKDIFEPFFTTKEEAKGIGLGLSVVYGIITRHNGSIEVKSELEKGSVFTVRLPIA